MQIWLTVGAVAVLAVIGFVVVLLLGLEKPWLQPIAIARAVLQLAILTIILNGVISSGVWVAVFLAVMVIAATWVVVRRLRLRVVTGVLIALVIAAAAAVPAVVVFVSGSVQFSPRYVLAVGGIIIGNAMTVSTLMGRSLAASFGTNRDEIEGWLALGATPRQASRRVVRLAASTALIPSTDQTRTTGIVTLPGAFVGAIFAGASVVAAAEFQVLVLASVLVAGALSVAFLSGVFGAPRVIPDGGRLVNSI